MEYLLIDPKTISKTTILGGNVDIDKYRYCIYNVQLLVLEPLLGTELYTKILADAEANTLAGLYLDLYTKFVKPIVKNESLAEYLHKLVRTEFWGYQSEESLSNEDLIAEKYQGIRPAPGYPACPDHTEKRSLFDLLDAEKAIGCELTENFAMSPASAVSGWYFSHPESRYFGTGKIGRDQLASLAARKGISEDELERWLRPVLD